MYRLYCSSIVIYIYIYVYVVNIYCIQIYAYNAMFLCCIFVGIVVWFGVLQPESQASSAKFTSKFRSTEVPSPLTSLIDLSLAVID